MRSVSQNQTSAVATGSEGDIVMRSKFFGAWSVFVTALCALVGAQQLERAVPLAVDYKAPPSSLRDAVRAADLVAIVRVTNKQYRSTPSGATTEFEAQVVEVLSNPQNLSVGSHIRIFRNGGVITVNGKKALQEELRFPEWPLGVRLIGLYGWSDQDQVFYPLSGPNFSYEEDGSGRAKTLGQGRVARSLHGKPFNEVVASIRSALR